MNNIIRALAFTLITGLSAKAQSFYAIDTIQKIEISFAQSNWDYILDTAKQGSDSYTMAQWVSINGTLYDSVGVKYKGNSSYNPNYAKNPFHIELDHFKDQEYQGYKDIKLSNGFNEPSFLRETLLYSIIQNYMPAPKANFAQVYVNGQYMGLYTNVESVTKTFLESRFYTNDHTFVFADNGGCNLVYKGTDSTLYYPNYTMKSDFGWSDLIALCDTLKNNLNGIESILDVDRTLWMLAITNSLVILDSYIGQPWHNYYMYQDHNGRFNPVIWDLNGGWGIFNRAGTGPDLTVTQLQNLSPTLHLNDTLWPLVNKLLNQPTYFNMYIAHIRTIMSENIYNNQYYNEALSMQGVADTAVLSDPNKFFTYAQFITNLNNNVISGPKTFPGITSFMNARSVFLSNSVYFQQMPPSITNVQPSNTSPSVNSSVYITAQIAGASDVYLGYRKSVMDVFTKVTMYDDGLHGDGAAGDGLFGASMTVASSQVQYYIYAENSGAGKFSPERAEYEYHILNASFVPVQSGELVINELMAINNSTVQNANGVYADWIELYNNTSGDLLLDNIYLSDDISTPFKWQFPVGTMIPAGGFLIVWADEDAAFGELHCNFKLSGNGEDVLLTYPNGYTVDQITYGLQDPDLTYGRYPNGTGPFVPMFPTFNTYNSITALEEDGVRGSYMTLFPNPSTGDFFISLNSNSSESAFLEIVDPGGRNVWNQTVSSGKNRITTNLASGIYFCKVTQSGENYPVQKMIIR